MRKPVISSEISQDSTAVATLILHIIFDIIVKRQLSQPSVLRIKIRSRSIDFCSIGEIVPVSHRFVESDIMGQLGFNGRRSH